MNGTTTEPSAAAMRLAQKIWGVGDIPLDASVEDVAAIIDAEMRLPLVSDFVDEARRYLRYVKRPVNAVLIARDALEDAHAHLQATRTTTVIDEAKAHTPTADELIQASRDAAKRMTAEARYAAVSRAAEELLNIADGFTGDPRHHAYELGKVARAMKADIAEAARDDDKTGPPQLLAACEQVIAKADEWKPSECVDGGYDSGVAHGWEGAAIILRPAVAKAKDTT